MFEAHAIVLAPLVDVDSLVQGHDPGDLVLKLVVLMHLDVTLIAKVG